MSHTRKPFEQPLRFPGPFIFLSHNRLFYVYEFLVYLHGADSPRVRRGGEGRLPPKHAGSKKKPGQSKASGEARGGPCFNLPQWKQQPDRTNVRKQPQGNTQKRWAEPRGRAIADGRQTAGIFGGKPSRRRLLRSFSL